MKKILAVATILLSAMMAFAQSDTSGTSSITDADTSTVGNDAAKNALREVSVDLFEREASWNVSISPDYGVITGRLFDGGPQAKEPLDDPENSDKADTKVLGVKTQFYRRGVNSFYITAVRPIPIEGVTKTCPYG